MTAKDEYSDKTVNQWAKEYVDLLNSPANGWGQHVHPRYGESHSMMFAMLQIFGDGATNAAIDAEFEKRKG